MSEPRHVTAFEQSVSIAVEIIAAATALLEPNQSPAAWTKRIEERARRDWVGRLLTTFATVQSWCRGKKIAPAVKRATDDVVDAFKRVRDYIPDVTNSEGGHVSVRPASAIQLDALRASLRGCFSRLQLLVNTPSAELAEEDSRIPKRYLEPLQRRILEIAGTGDGTIRRAELVRLLCDEATGNSVEPGSIDNAILRLVEHGLFVREGRGACSLTDFGSMVLSGNYGDLPNLIM